MIDIIIIILGILFLVVYAYWITIYAHNNKELMKNLEEYDKKEKAKQQESKIHGQKQAKRKNSKTKRTRLYHS
tara:strand:+ start:3391 stop:3609 length:219 start_codon:yes stop_codon:yes gene_type:complete